ncbi:MAG TPA: hypothetical protein VHL31_23345 [Geminicoccus sp.]|uniref:hypothetical protein n=1 Tax=Geminicoccus sp. TaxID=2024832 RepID=UPI002E381BA4|nr:hypothetical protein [Geminicoccus sp.]HEX2529220.1 hypothetical protein [Geminicoccus sp.]
MSCTSGGLADRPADSRRIGCKSVSIGAQSTLIRSRHWLLPKAVGNSASARLT